MQTARLCAGGTRLMRLSGLFSFRSARPMLAECLAERQTARDHAHPAWRLALPQSGMV